MSDKPKPRHPIILPPRVTNYRGEIRHVGVEIEMSGLTLESLAEHTARFFDLKVEPDGRYQRRLTGDPAGDWQVELDFSLLKEMGHRDQEVKELMDDVRNTAEELLRLVSEPFVPLELISPPLPMDRLEELEQLIILLRGAGATGSSDNLINAFGMQFNPEIPDRDPAVLTAYLKAFLCVFDWLHKRSQVDMTRRLTSYVDPFPMAYVRKVVHPDYWPDTEQLIDDYLHFNPTRNRALDMLPLFLWLDEARVRRKAKDPLIKPRPTFHYRLPNSEIHRRDWGLYVAWEDWLEVEYLADDAKRLEDCCRAYSRFLSSPLRRWFGNWEREVAQKWLSQ